MNNIYSGSAQAPNISQQNAVPSIPNRVKKPFWKTCLIITCTIVVIIYLGIIVLFNYYLHYSGSKDWGNVTIGLQRVNDFSQKTSKASFKLVLITDNKYTTCDPAPIDKYSVSNKNNETYITLQNIMPSKLCIDGSSDSSVISLIDIGDLKSQKTIHLIEKNNEAIFQIVPSSNSITFKLIKNSSFVNFPVLQFNQSGIPSFTAISYSKMTNEDRQRIATVVDTELHSYCSRTQLYCYDTTLNGKDFASDRFFAGATMDNNGRQTNLEIEKKMFPKIKISTGDTIFGYTDLPINLLYEQLNFYEQPHRGLSAETFSSINIAQIDSNGNLTNIPK